MSEIKEMSGKMNPGQILNKLANKYDELTQPTGLQQIYDLQHRERKKDKNIEGHTHNFADQIRHLENLVSENSKFVIAIIRTNAKTPCIVLFTDEQIEDLQNLCCTGKAILGVDKTFNLCKMHVTVTCYKQITVTRMKNGQPPIFLGPLYIHDNSDFESYSHFFYQLKLKLIDTPLHKLVIGSDARLVYTTFARKCATFVD
jgi:hypothetical protein